MWGRGCLVEARTCETCCGGIPRPPMMRTEGFSGALSGGEGVAASAMMASKRESA